MKVYDGANWITATAAGTTAMLVYKYVATSGQTIFSGAASVGGTLSYTSNNIIVFVNGVSLDSTDYTATNGTSVVLASGAALNDEVVIVAFKSFTVADTYTKGEVDAFAVKLTGAQTVAGVKTFSSDVVANGLTVGRGAGSVATNTAVGYQAINSGSSSGGFNVAVGYQSMVANTTGAGNSSFGYGSLAANTTGGNNFAGGLNSLLSNTTGGSNTAVGRDALGSNTTASNNTAVGYQAGYGNTVGIGNVHIGYQAGYTNGAGNNYNTFVGYLAGYAAARVSGNALNTAIGYAAGTALTNGYYNTFIGPASGSAVTTGYNNTIIGGFSGNQGGLDIRALNNYIVLSDGDGNPRFYWNGSTWYYTNLSSGAGTNALKWNTTTGAITFDTSSARYKDNIRDSVYGLNHVMQMRSTQFEYKDTGRSDVGLIAEELQPIIPELVGVNKDGQADSVSYDRMVSVLVKAIQELKAEFDAYKEAHP